LNLNKPVFVGYDWGASIGLKMVIKNPNQLSKVIAFHPSIDAKSLSNNEIKRLKTPILI